MVFDFTMDRVRDKVSTIERALKSNAQCGGIRGGVKRPSLASIRCGAFNFDQPSLHGAFVRMRSDAEVDTVDTGGISQQMGLKTNPYA